MSSREIDGVIIECVQGNIADQPDVDAIVNAANAELRMGGGVAGAIHRAAGPGLEEEGRDLAPIAPGQAVVTSGHDLPNRYVIQCLGPIYGRDEPSNELLASCYHGALHLAEQCNVRSMAFPAISTGVFGYPLEAATRVAVAAVLDDLPGLSSVRLIRFVLFSQADLQVYTRTIEELAG